MIPVRVKEEELTRSGRHRLDTIAMVLIASVWVALILVALRTNANSPTSGDERYHHLPAVHQIANQFPHVEWHTLPLATGFAYHALLASFVKAGIGDIGLRIINAALVAGAVFIIAGSARQVLDRLAALFMLAMFVDAYFIGAARWIGSEGGYFLLTAAVLVATCREETSLASRGGTALAAGLACLVRQTGLFLSMMSSTVDLLIDRRNFRRFTSWAMLLVPSGVALALLYKAYGGLTPEGVYRTYNVQVSLTPLAFVPASGALFFVVIALLMPRVRQQVRSLPFLLGGLVGLAAPSAPGIGREQSPIWLVARQAPIIGGRSIVVVVLASVAVGCIVALVRSLWQLGEQRTGAMVAVAVAALAVVHIPSGQMYARYFEPILLLVALLGLMRLPDRACILRVLLVFVAIGTLQSLLLLRGSFNMIG
jgi:hypothetical protein